MKRQATLNRSASILCILLLSFQLSAKAAIDWPTLSFSEVVTNVFNKPVAITHAGDGSQRLFVVQQAGSILIIQNSNVLAQPFLDITSRVTSAGAEQGLLGLAFPPGFPATNHFYVAYTISTSNALVISRFQLSSTNANVADTNSEQVILKISKSYNNHNSGQLTFGPDGHLYIGIGDGGSEGDPQSMGQKTNSLLAKILRIDVESGVSPYAVPAGNPFVNTPGFVPETWAWGLRNPWRFSFDRSTGDLYIGDVGQDQWEEIDFQAAGSAGGQNYGWRIMEGPTNYAVPAGFTNFSSLTLPVFSYNHSESHADGGAAVIGGYVYRGPSQSRMDGMYFCGDEVAGWFWGLKRIGTNWQSMALVSSTTLPQYEMNMSSFGEDDDGNLLVADWSGGKIYQIYDSQQAWAPVFSPPTNTINSNSVLVTCVTPNAETHYTTNGVDPTLADAIVPTNGLIQVANGVTNKVRAFRADLAPSAVSSMVYKLQVATPAFSPAPGYGTNPTFVTINTTSPGAVIYYTTDGSYPGTNSSIYSGPVVLQKITTLNAVAIEPGFFNSSLGSGFYDMPQTTAPLISPLPGQVAFGTSVSISSSTPASTIYYTTDGSIPTTNSQVYSSPFQIIRDTKVIAFAASLGNANSALTTYIYTLPPAPIPVFSPAAGTLTKGTQISITSATLNPVIYYTLDGSTPTTNSAVYATPIIFSNTFTLSARVKPANFDLSPTKTNFYGLRDAEMTVVTTIAGALASGYSNGMGGNALFYQPHGICLDQYGNLFVADSGNNVVRKISPAGEVTTFAGTGASGNEGGATTNAQFTFPLGICTDPSGNLYVFNSDSCYTLNQIDTNDNVTIYAQPGINWTICGDLPTPGYLFDVAGRVYFGLYFIVGVCVAPGNVQALTDQYYDNFEAYQLGPAIDTSSNIYIAVGTKVWKQDASGLHVYAGGKAGYLDGVSTNTLFQGPQALALDSQTNLYVTDASALRKIRLDGTVTTVAGTGIAGYANGPGTIAQFNGLGGVCLDTNGNAYAVDTGNNCIRKISPDTAGIGIADDWQMKYFGHIGIDPNADPDHDGMSNYQEFWAGTDPTNPASVFAVKGATLIGTNTVQIQWPTAIGKSYMVQYSTDLISWTNLGSTVAGDGSIATAIDNSTSQDSGQRFYRIAITGF